MYTLYYWNEFSFFNRCGYRQLGNWWSGWRDCWIFSQGRSHPAGVDDPLHATHNAVVPCLLRSDPVASHFVSGTRLRPGWCQDTNPLFKPVARVCLQTTLSGTFAYTYKIRIISHKVNFNKISTC